MKLLKVLSMMAFVDVALTALVILPNPGVTCEAAGFYDTYTVCSGVATCMSNLCDSAQAVYTAASWSYAHEDGHTIPSITGGWTDSWTDYYRGCWFWVEDNSNAGKWYTNTNSAPSVSTINIPRTIPACCTSTSEGDCVGDVATANAVNDGTYTAGPAPTTTPTPAPTSGNGGGAVGDPHVFGPHGDLYDFKGRNNTWYNFFSSRILSVAVLFLHDIYNWRRKVVYGSWMKAVAITAMTGSNHTLKIAYSSDKPSVAEVGIGDDGPTTLRENEALDIGNMKLALSDKHVLSFSNAEWSVEAKNRYLPYHAKNGQKKRLDISVRPIANVDASPVAPHGLVGQMYDRDDLKVIGKLDNYKVPGKVIVTSAMGEGAIEGTADELHHRRYQPLQHQFQIFAVWSLVCAPTQRVLSDW